MTPYEEAAARSIAQFDCENQLCAHIPEHEPTGKHRLMAIAASVAIARAGYQILKREQS